MEPGGARRAESEAGHGGLIKEPGRGFRAPRSQPASHPKMGSPHRCMLGMFYMSTRCLLSPSGRSMMSWSSSCRHPPPLMLPPPLLWPCLSRLPVPSAPAASGGTKVNHMMGWHSWGDVGQVQRGGDTRPGSAAPMSVPRTWEVMGG